MKIKTQTTTSTRTANRTTRPSSHTALLIALCGSAAAATSVNAQLVLTSDFTQNGGVLAIPNGPNQLTISHASNPLLTLSNGANGNAVSRLLMGTQFGHSGSMVLEQNSVMTLNLNGPFSPFASIGQAHGSTGHVRVRTGALLNTIGSTIVGELGNGTLIVEQGGRVVSPFLLVASEGTSQGSVLVTGQNSRIDLESDVGSPGFTIGAFGASGTMIVSNGGVVTALGDGHVGWSTNGVLSVFDPGSSVVLGGEFRVGFNNMGQGTANISNGALLVSHGSKIGANASSGNPATNGNVTVTGNGTLWSNHGELILGTANAIGPAEFPSSGSLTVSNNANVVNTDTLTIGRTSHGVVNVNGGATLSAAAPNAAFPFAGMIGFSNTATGVANVSGPGSAMNFNGGLVVGNSGQGSLFVTNGATVTSTEGYIAFFQSSLAAVTVAGEDSRWINSENAYVGGNWSNYDNNTWGGQGSLFVRDGGLVQAQGNRGLTVLNLALLAGGGGTIIANTVENRGNIAVGNADATGIMTIAGNYNQTNTGNLVVRLNGTEAGTGHDQLAITNQAMLAGSLSVLVWFDLGFNQTFDILTSNSVLSGQFAGLDNDSLVGTYNGVDLFIRYLEIEGPAGNGGIVQLYTVPAPGSAILFAAGLAAFTRRRRTIR